MAIRTRGRPNPLIRNPHSITASRRRSLLLQRGLKTAPQVLRSGLSKLKRVSSQVGEPPNPLIEKAKKQKINDIKKWLKQLETGQRISKTNPLDRRRSAMAIAIYTALEGNVTREKVMQLNPILQQNFSKYSPTLQQNQKLRHAINLMKIGYVGKNQNILNQAVAEVLQQNNLL
jgi:hypothetical protein